MTPSLALDRIGQVSIIVTDLDRAVRFYRDTLGMRFLFQAPPGLAFFDCGGVRIMLDRLAEAVGGVGTSILYYTVDDIQAAHRTLTERGATFVNPPHIITRLGNNDLWMAAFRDSEGNLLQIMSEVPHDATAH